MDLQRTKIYIDGSHFIATPKNAFSHRRGRYKLSRQPFSVQKIDLSHANSPPNAVNENLPPTTNVESLPTTPKQESPPTAPKEKFESAYKESLSLPKRERKAHIKEQLKDTFKDKAELSTFVDDNVERMRRNTVKRKVRLSRKLNLQQCTQPWSYFVTFTYSDEKHTEESFRKKLTTTLKHLVARKGWKYIGVWERGKDTNRLHFHGIFYIPEDGMVGELKEVEDYDTRKHRQQKTWQNTYFETNFGRNDFKDIVLSRHVNDAAQYITKYMEKTGEKLVFGGKLPTYFKSDILEPEIVCPMGVDGRKMLLFDDFTCIDNGTIMGKASPKVIDQMPKCN